MSGFSKVFENAIEYRSIEDAVKAQRLPMGVVGLSAVHKAHYISSLCMNLQKKAVILCQDEASATRLCEDLNVFSSGAVVFPARDFHFR
ncbi:MAG: hypothetical protein NC110_00540, partial [Ruminococcus sp.]|nr:hypothetical protein [Ruminococcus sp.]